MAMASCGYGGASWEPVGLSGGGGMFTPAISAGDPNLMMVNCDMSGAYISEDGGRNWRMINQSQLRSDTRCRGCFDPSEPNVIYASSGGMLRVSRDRGRTFSAVDGLKERVYGEISVSPFDSRVLLAGVGSGGCRVSHDAGATWAGCDGPRGMVIGFGFDRTRKGQVVFAATEDGVWRSDDGGRKWAEKTGGLPWKQIEGFACGSNEGDDAVMLYCTIPSKIENGSLNGGVYRSRDRGETWERAMGQGINTETEKADQWAYGAISQYKQILTTDTRPLTVYALNTSTGFHPPHHETVYRSDDGGESWRDVFFIDPRFERYNVAPNYFTASTGQSYKGGGTPFGAAICSSDPDRLMLVWSQCYITHDGGEKWFNGHTYPAAGEKPGPGSAWVCNGLVVTTTWHYYIDPFESKRHYIAYTDIGLGRSVDGGESWIWWDKRSWAPWRNTCYEIAFDPEIRGKMWGAFSDVHDIPNDNIISERHGHNRPGGVCISRDFGASWRHEAESLPARPVTSIVTDSKSKADSRTLYAGVFMEGVYKSTDDGRTWTLKKNGLGHPKNMRVYRVVLHRDGTLFAIICAKRSGGGKALMSEGVGLYRSRDGAESWEKLNYHRLKPVGFSRRT
ncbi:MAG: exo-alpha-sialidase, partial [Sedimentisphaerales bacterium]|nr:exo-alpha-sialidase [Sedimentisphaerales bacterium]